MIASTLKRARPIASAAEALAPSRIKIIVTMNTCHDRSASHPGVRCENCANFRLWASRASSIILSLAFCITSPLVGEGARHLRRKSSIQISNSQRQLICRTVIASEAKQSISPQRKHGLLRFARNDVPLFALATRSARPPDGQIT
jgi:hypothetical protein